MTMPLVSVVMAVRNGGTDLPKAVQSILGQTFANLELIIVNDGSTDNTARYMDNIDDTRVRVVHQENHGCAKAANVGIQLARGKYIARLDHDDLAKPTRLAKQVEFLENNPDHALIGTWADIWVKDRPTKRSHDFPTDNAVLQLELLFHNPFVQSSILMRKSAVDAVGGYCTDPERQPPEDYELWSRLARRYKLANLPERLTVYRELPNSQSRLGANPFQKKLLVITAENIAAIEGLVVPTAEHLSIAALIHQDYDSVQIEPSLARLDELVTRAGFQISGGQLNEDIDLRVAAWKRNLRSRLRRRHLRKFTGPLWPLFKFGWSHLGLRSTSRLLESGFRKLASGK